MDEQTAYHFGVHWKIAGDDEASDGQRLLACETCLEIDPHHAGVHFLAGQLHWKNQRSSEARVHLTAARDDDVCPLRATTPIIQTVLQLADAHQLRPIRCDDLFDQTDSLLRALPDGIPDPQRFVDHLHPSISGHQEIARAVSEQLFEAFQIQADPSAEPAYQELALEHLSSLDESYFARGKQRLEGLRNWAAGRAEKLPID